MVSSKADKGPFHRSNLFSCETVSIMLKACPRLQRLMFLEFQCRKVSLHCHGAIHVLSEGAMPVSLPILDVDVIGRLAIDFVQRAAIDVGWL